MAERDIAIGAIVSGREAGAVRPGIVRDAVNSVLGLINRVSGAGVRFLLETRQPGDGSVDLLTKISDFPDPLVATTSWSKKVRSQGPGVEPSRLTVVTPEVQV